MSLSTPSVCIYVTYNMCMFMCCHLIKFLVDIGDLYIYICL